MIGFGFSVFTQAILGAGGFAKGSSLALDFTSGNRRLDPRITFSRTTNATVTGSNGLIQNAPHNLLTHSEQFDNAAWVKNDATVSANSTAAPDGTITADTLTATAGTFAIAPRVSQNNANAEQRTLSIYAKAGSYNFVKISPRSFGGVGGIVVDLTTGQITSTAVTVPPTATSVVSAGNGWWRISLSTASPGATQTVRVALSQTATSDSDGSTYTGDEFIYVWGAQLELGSTATTYNPTTVKNLLGFTEHFDNAAWTKSNASISATKVDDIYGQPFAQKLVENTAAGLHYFDQPATTVAGAVYTGSVYLKAGERSWARLQFVGAAYFPNLYVNLTDGTVGTVENSPTSYSVVGVGNGWYRVSISAAPDSASTRFRIYSATANNTASYTGDGTSGIYIFGAQLSDSASVDPYVYQPVAAPTSTAYYGPRFDYDPVTLAPKGLLIEEQRTNLVTYSEQFDNIVWTKSGLSVDANTLVCPDGAVSAEKVVDSAVTGPHEIFRTLSGLTTSTSYSFSFYAKAGEKTKVQPLINFIGGTRLVWAVINLTTGTVDSTSANVTATVNAVGNGWFRINLTGSTGAAISGNFGFSLSPTGGSFNYTGDGTSGIYIWGAQLEAGAFATSYIPTVASQVTRAADSASMIGNNFARWYNVTSGTFFVEWASAESGNGDILNVSDGTANNFISTFKQAAALYTQYVVVGGSLSVNQNRSQTYPVGTFYKNSFAYKAADFSSTVNGGAMSTTLSGTVPVVSRLNIGTNATGAGEHINGPIKRIAFYSRVLSGAEQQGITS